MTEERLFTFTQDEVKQMFIDRIPKDLGRIRAEQVTLIQSGGKTTVRVDLSPPKVKTGEPEPMLVDGYNEELDDEYDDEDSVDNEEDE